MFEHYSLGKSILQHLCEIGRIVPLPQKDYGNETVYYVPMHLKPWTIKKAIVPCRNSAPLLRFAQAALPHPTDPPSIEIFMPSPLPCLLATIGFPKRSSRWPACHGAGLVLSRGREAV